jgi:hypothetical protein
MSLEHAPDSTKEIYGMNPKLPAIMTWGHVWRGGGKTVRAMRNAISVTPKSVHRCQHEIYHVIPSNHFCFAWHEPSLKRFNSPAYRVFTLASNPNQFHHVTNRWSWGVWPIVNTLLQIYLSYG